MGQSYQTVWHNCMGLYVAVITHFCFNHRAFLVHKKLIENSNFKQKVQAIIMENPEITAKKNSQTTSKPTSTSTTSQMTHSSSQSWKGWISGFIGVVIFAGSLPATRLAVMEFDPIFLTAARASIAAMVSGVALLCIKQPLPKKSDLPALMMVAFGVVIGFPLFSALALQYVTSAHAIVFLGILPLCTAIFAVWRGGERPSKMFWLFSLLGSAFVVGYAILSNASAGLSSTISAAANAEHNALLGGILMLAAVVVCGLGYAEGGRLSRTLGGWQVISWALLFAAPIMLLVSWLTLPDTLDQVSISAWAGLLYVSLFSMFIGFVFWYRGLALGGIAAVGQLQLLQPFMGLALAALLLHETVSLAMVISTLGAVVCVAGAKKFA